MQRPFAPLTLYVEGIVGGPAEVVVSLVSAADPESVIAQDRVKVYVLDANINMNSDNDYSHRIDPTDDAIEDQSPAPGKPPELCKGCPHRNVFELLRDLGCIVTGDIGCYTLGVLPPFNAMDTCVCMGASCSTPDFLDRKMG